ncbi:MAG: DUF3556 domain-containing protein [Aeromicrobium sp.]|uniref:DUF3556 domain-containing protein n=1 Tax=Aeromicrobium sp. TaxID=1871063 RepID=UPI0039E672A6
MPFTEPTLPPLDPAHFRETPFFERIKIETTFWAENGFGSPKALHVLYVLKVVVLSIVGGVSLATSTSEGVGAPWEVAQWWDQPIVWQKLVLWVALLEVIGVGGAWGPLTGHFKPFYGGARYWLRPGTIRLPAWPDHVPLTKGDTRTVVDALLYAAVLVSLAVALALPGVTPDHMDDFPADVHGGSVNPVLMLMPVAFLVLVGLRDKVVFLAARGEQYVPVMLSVGLLSFTSFADMIVAAKLIIVVVWVGAAVSKIGEHFLNVIPPMVSNTPWTPRFLRRAHYRDFPDDLRPSKLAWFMGHVLGTLAEMAVPLVLLFSANPTITLLGVLSMVAFHAFITSTFPLAVPLEWNILFGYLAVFLFLGYPNADGYGLGDVSRPWLLPAILAALLFWPVLGNLRPDLVSFLPSMRQYAGNWASAVWAMAPGVEERFNELPIPVRTHTEQLAGLGYEPDAADLTVELFIAWRSMHSQGRGLLSVLSREFGDDMERYVIREGEFGANLVVGWNFGDGHLHDEQLIEAIQRRLRFAPGEFVVAWVESQPIHKKTQEYKIIDAAVGVVERGTWKVADCVAEQPWLPDGPVAHEVAWRHPDYHRPEL